MAVYAASHLRCASCLPYTTKHGTHGSEPCFHLIFAECTHLCAGVVHFFGRLSFLVDENAHAVHFFISALLQLLDRYAWYIAKIQGAGLLCLSAESKVVYVRLFAGLARCMESSLGLFSACWVSSHAIQLQQQAPQASKGSKGSIKPNRGSPSPAVCLACHLQRLGLQQELPPIQAVLGKVSGRSLDVGTGGCDFLVQHSNYLDLACMAANL